MLSTTKDPPKMDVRCIKPYDDQVPEFFRTFLCDSGNVREVLAPEVDYFTSRCPVLVVAPTGSYKSTFALLELVSRAIKSGKNVLIILNRVALATQLKLRVMEITESPLLGRLTDKGIRETEYFAQVCVITYHKLPAFVKDLANADWIKNLMYVVADEIHFFSTDSAFVKKTGYYLKILTTHFQHAIRVYMTATEWDVLVPLAEAEKANYVDFQKLTHSGIFPRKFLRYVFPADYSHVNLSFFNDICEIIAKINVNPDEKWMLFVGSKKEGKAIAKELGDRAIYLDADSKGTDAWNELLKNNQFRVQVLVTTAVLDCGVNVIDSKLRNIAIITDDRTRLIQMLGRKRCQPDESVNLFVYDMDEQTISKRYHDGEELCQWLDRYEKENFEGRSRMANEIWDSEQDSLRHYFDLAKGHLVPNYMAFFALKRKMTFYESILSEEITFKEAVRGWLDKESVSVEGSTDLEERFLSFCEERLNQELNGEEIAKLREMTITIADRVGKVKTRADRLDSIGIDALNKRLESFNCPYRIARNAWKIIKDQEE